MGTIQVMPPHLANQIAAGEVVERPASCVKELVENAIDAKAQSVQVELLEGGIRKIVVQDDGIGMDEEDARLAFARHATSKLMTARDLFRVTTLGFRGEALASIAAIAKVTLQTRQHHASQGVRLRVEGTTEVEPMNPIGMPPGTRIEVDELFFNTPARLKYLRTVQTEQARCVEVVQKAALGHPDIAFRCIIDGHVVFQSAGRGQLREALAALYGAGEAKQMLELNHANSDYQVTGFIGQPTQARATRSHAHIYVNQRPIRNLAIVQAVAAGYQNRLMVGRHPLFVLHITLQPTLVDVNIHPHKAEVRFSEERDLCLLIQNAVRSTLDKAFLVPTISEAVPRKKSVDTSSQATFQLQPENVIGQSPSSSRPVDDSLGELETSVKVNSSVSRGIAGDRYESRKNFQTAEYQAVVREALRPTEVAASAVENYSMSQNDAKPSPSDAATSVGMRPENWRLRPIGQALGMYILADDGESLYIIDQHAAHERVLYELFDSRMKERAAASMPLLTPVNVTLLPLEYAWVIEHQAAYEAMGLVYEPFGGYDVIVRNIPDIWEGLDYARLIQDTFADCDSSRVKLQNVQEALRESIVMRACKAAIKANWYLSDAEMQALCESLSNLADPFHCPHGRPVFLRLSARDLEKGFRRIV